MTSGEEMITFKQHTMDTASQPAKKLLEKANRDYGMIPSMHAVMAESPQALEAYQVMYDLFANSSLSKEQRHVVWLTASVTNACHYCVPAHSMIAIMDGFDKNIIKAIRAEQSIQDEQLEALRKYTRSVVINRGNIDKAEVLNMKQLGYTNQNLLDILLGVSHKVLSNYVNFLVDTPIDEPFLPYSRSSESDEG